MAWTAPKTWTVGEVLTAAGLNTHLRDNLLELPPVGTIWYFGYVSTAGHQNTQVIEGRFLEANGAPVSRTTYADLHTKVAAAGYPDGSGDGSTTFNVADLFGRAPWGMGSHADMNALSDSDGLASGSRRVKHAHTIQANREAVANDSPGSHYAGNGVSTSENSSSYAVRGVWGIRF